LRVGAYNALFIIKQAWFADDNNLQTRIDLRADYVAFMRANAHASIRAATAAALDRCYLAN